MTEAAPAAFPYASCALVLASIAGLGQNADSCSTASGSTIGLDGMAAVANGASAVNVCVGAATFLLVSRIAAENARMMLTEVNRSYAIRCDKLITRAADLVPEPWPFMELSPILHSLALVESASLLTGFGDPYYGKSLKSGSDRLAELQAQLENALPDPAQWDGPAAEAYAEWVNDQLDDVKNLAVTDLGLADGAANCADWVTILRLSLGALRMLLLAAYVIEAWYYASAGYVLQPCELGFVRGFALCVTITGVGALGAILSLVLPGNGLHLEDGPRSAARSYASACAPSAGATGGARPSAQLIMAPLSGLARSAGRRDGLAAGQMERKPRNLYSDCMSAHMFSSDGRPEVAAAEADPVLPAVAPAMSMFTAPAPARAVESIR